MHSGTYIYLNPHKSYLIEIFPGRASVVGNIQKLNFTLLNLKIKFITLMNLIFPIHKLKFETY